MKKIVFFAIFFCFITSHGGAQTASPFGVCMHLGGGWEHHLMPTNIGMVRDAGIHLIRADFSWSAVEGQQGVWTFDRLDRVVEETGKLGLQLLAPLLYDRPWAHPVYEHLDAWLTYVEKVVTRYKDKVHYWEVWNEPNLYPRFWDKPNDAANYVVLLKATYQKIKQIDPSATVVHGGTAMIPWAYIEKSLADGSGLFFDKLAIHPYRGVLDSWEETLRYKTEIDRLKALMAKYKMDHKSIWITEMGLSTKAVAGPESSDVFHEAKAKTGKDWKVAVVCDDVYSILPSFTAQDLRKFFPAGFRLDTVQILDLRKVRANEYDAVFFPPSENAPMHITMSVMEYLTNYLRGGGKVYYFAGGSMYYCGDAAKKNVDQANYLAQTMWLSLRFGTEKYFHYEMESGGTNVFDREDNFGLTQSGLNPKPAYQTYATMGKLFPEGSQMDTSVEWRQKDCCVVSWKQPDGTRVWAVWSPEGLNQVKVKIGKGWKQTLNQWGVLLPAVTEITVTMETGAGVIYLVGPEQFEIQ